MIRTCNKSDTLSVTEMVVQSVPSYCPTDTVTYMISMGGDHCHNSTRARFSYSGRAISYSGRAISYSGRAVSYSGRAISYSGRAVSYLGGAISLQLRNSTLDKKVLLQLRYRHSRLFVIA